MGWLADDQQHLPGEHVPLLGQAGQERGVLECGGFQRRVRQPAGGLAQRDDGADQVGPPGPDQHLDRAGQRVQPESGLTSTGNARSEPAYEFWHGTRMLT